MALLPFSEENLEGTLWEDSKKYSKGEINAEQINVSLSRYSKILKRKYILSIFGMFIWVLAIIFTVVAYTIYKDNNFIVISCTCLSIILPQVYQISRDVISRLKRNKAKQH